MSKITDNFYYQIYNFFRKIRKPFTIPLAKLLQRLNISANFISNFRLFLLLGFFFLWVYDYTYISLILLTINLILDAVDGDLARNNKKASDLGHFQDLIADNFMAIVIALALIWLNLLPKFLGPYYIFILGISWWLSVIKHNYGKKTDWLIHPEASGLTHMLRFWIPTSLVYFFILLNINIFYETILVIAIILTIVGINDYIQIIKKK